MTTPTRDRWGSRAAFVLAAVGSAVGLGNIWRYPKAAFEGGGGAFLIPYFIALLTAGIPLLMLEFGLGHRMQGAAPTSMARINKRSEFIGWWAALGGLFITFYYTILMAWVCFYLWELGGTLFSGASALPWADDPLTFLLHDVVTGDHGTSQSELSFSRMNWGALGFNAVVWAFIYYAIRNGVHSVGKVVWVTVLLPYALLMVLFAVAITREGAPMGLSYYLTPDFTKFTEPATGELSLRSISNIASKAYGQIFFSLSIGFGIMMAYASFLPKKSDIANNATITAFSNSGTEFFAGFITFSMLGFLALNAGVFVEDQRTGGMLLALVSYPSAISELPLGVTGQALIGIAFFGSLLFLGVDSAFSLVEAMVAGVSDKFGVSRKAITMVFCCVGWVVGVIFCTPGGLALLDVVDHYLADYGLLLVGLLQCIMVGWVYGARNLRDHINRVSEKKISPFFDICVKYITPPILVVILYLQAERDFAFLWDPAATPYEGYSMVSQCIGIGVLLSAVVFGILLATRKPASASYHERPEFTYES